MIAADIYRPVLISWKHLDSKLMYLFLLGRKFQLVGDVCQGLEQAKANHNDYGPIDTAKVPDDEKAHAGAALMSKRWLIRMRSS